MQMGLAAGRLILGEVDVVRRNPARQQRIAQGLGFPWSLVAIVRVVPRALRDRLYMLVARNRFRWFGRRDTMRRAMRLWGSAFLTMSR